MRPGMLPLLLHPRRSQYTPTFEMYLISINQFLKITKLTALRKQIDMRINSPREILPAQKSIRCLLYFCHSNFTFYLKFDVICTGVIQTTTYNIVRKYPCA